MIPGTFEDARLEYYYNQALDSRIEFLSRLTEVEARRLLALLMYSPGNFLKAQGVFWAVYPQLAHLFTNRKVTDLEMRAGEGVIFTSLNMHASNPNTTENETRLAFAGRFTTNDVMVYPGQTHDEVSTPEGKVRYSLERIGSMQVHGSDQFGHNRIFTELQDKVFV